MEQYVFLDFEFSMPEKHVNRGSFTPEIIEAGIVTVREDTVIDTYSSFIKPEIHPKLTKHCCTFLNITQTQVDNGESFNDLVQKIRSIVKQSSTTIVTWGNSDLHILRAGLRRRGEIAIGTYKELDLAEAYKQFFGGHNLTSLKNAVLDYVGVDFNQMHRALDDALATYEVFKHYQKDRRFINSNQQTTIGDRLDMTKLLTLFQN